MVTVENALSFFRKAIPAPYLHLLVLAIACGCPHRAYAHGEIVYSARYYLPPGSSGHSHYHIYRVDPDGTHRLQLSFGNSDDYCPVWTGGDDRISFYREVKPSSDCYSMEMKQDGSHLHRIRQVNEFDIFDHHSQSMMRWDNEWSPNRRYDCATTDMGNDINIIDSESTKSIGKVPYSGGIVWLSNSEFATLNIINSGKFEITTYNTFGRQLSCILLNDTSSRDNLEETEEYWAADFWSFTFHPNTARPGSYFVEMWAKRTSVLYALDPARKTIKFLTNADCESWSPDNSTFCTCVFKGTSPYDSERVVWTSLLATVDPQTLKVRIIQGGLIDCSGADWKDGRRLSLW
jgi:hypothetical protein